MEPSELAIEKLDSAAIMSWSDKRREEFCDTFHARVRASRAILQAVISGVLERTAMNHMLGHRAANELRARLPNRRELLDRSSNGQINYDLIGGRSVKELDEIAGTRIHDLMKSFPSMVEAVQVIDQTTAARMRKKDALVAECTSERDELEGVCEPISMKSMLDTKPGMSLREFVDLVETRDKRRMELIASLEKKMEEGVRLEGEIAKALYRGLPGLSEAIVEVITDLINQDKALDISTRRVSEKVRFGDNEAAVEILSHFEKDEVKVTGDIASKIQAAVANLGIPQKGKKNVKGTASKKSD